MQLKELYRDSYRFRFIFLSLVFFLALNLCLRASLIIFYSADFADKLFFIPVSLLLGITNDIVTFCFAGLPLAFLILLLPEKMMKTKLGRGILFFILFTFVFIFVFTAVSEFFFWDEFHSKFNFIAVDYLVYSNEVIQNIWESYPMLWILAAIGLISFLISYFLWKLSNKPLIKKSQLTFGQLAKANGFARRALIALCLTIPALVLFLFFNPLVQGKTRYLSELSRNGVYEIFSAFRHNELDYRAFYPTIESKRALLIVEEIKLRNAGGAAFASPAMLKPEANTLPNVVVVVMESMGTKRYNEKVTPNLLKLSRQGLSFSNMQATGTRTVRGIEAITLSVPPTPGNSIVRRHNNDNLFSMGTLFKQRGYDLKFIYGGLGYFDNMNDYFADNGYEIVDRLDFSASNKTFANAWGQCDNDLFNESITQADLSYDQGKAFHQILLTTSNHRPFTFPDSEGIVPDGSRTQAIKYSDWAIGKFIQNASTKPWFNNTIFMFVGDHPARIEGGDLLPGENYSIVAIVYAPKIIKPQEVNTLCSQIDLAPTLFDFLGWDYNKRFLGRNVLAMRPEEGRAWVSTYQLLGYMDTHGLATLQPNSQPEIRVLNKQDASGNNISYFSAPENLSAWSEKILETGIGSYQYAYDLFKSGAMKE